MATAFGHRASGHSGNPEMESLSPDLPERPDDFLATGRVERMRPCLGMKKSRCHLCRYGSALFHNLVASGQTCGINELETYVTDLGANSLESQLLFEFRGCRDAGESQLPLLRFIPINFKTLSLLSRRLKIVGRCAAHTPRCGRLLFAAQFRTRRTANWAQVASCLRERAPN
jgi:hypothetical protein